MNKQDWLKAKSLFSLMQLQKKQIVIELKENIDKNQDGEYFLFGIKEEEQSKFILIKTRMLKTLKMANKEIEMYINNEEYETLEVELDFLENGIYETLKDRSYWNINEDYYKAIRKMEEFM